MPLNLSIIDKEEADLTIDYRGHIINLKFKPNAYTDAFMEAHRGKTVAETLPDLITEWDIVREVVVKKQEKGKEIERVEVEKIPVDDKGMKLLPLSVINALWDGIMEAIFPNLKTQTNGGSFT